MIIEYKVISLNEVILLKWSGGLWNGTINR